jgi:hypothetical protein
MPFTRTQFLEVFRDYNEGVWPAQLVLIALALIALSATVRGTLRATTVAASVLVALWLWMAVAYHWLYFTSINAAAWVFGAMFIAQAVLLGRSAADGRLCFGLTRSWSARIGVAIIVYSLLLYPLLSQLGDHAYPRSPSFGLPCPTTLFTLGMLLLTTERVPMRLLVVPAAWAALASTAAFAFGIWEDVGLTLAALTTLVVLAVRDHVPRRKPAAAPTFVQHAA